ncbi:MAG: flagellar filament capping protein FliD [Lachnospiraceae bacterium]|nr:flagellar filament capping protein FliD [Lachnospiraceae bacterium]
MSDMMRLTGLSSGMDTESIVSAMVSAKKVKVDEAKQAQTKLEWTQDAWKDMNSKIYGLYSGKLSNMRFSNTYNKKTTTTSNSALSVVSGESAVNGVYTAKIKSLAKAGYLTGAEISTKSGGKVTGSTKLTDLGIVEGSVIGIKNGGKTTQIEIGKDMTMNQLVNKLQAAGVNASFDEGNQRLFVSAKETGAANDFLFAGGGANETDALNKLGLTAKAGSTRIKGSDAELVLNDATFKSSTNTFTINGSTYTVNRVVDEEISITTENDTSGIYDMVKDFFSDYNDVMNSMLGAYNADSAKGYEPLTDEQKEVMTEQQIEDWEAKIKDSLLRKDSTLSGVMTAMRNAMNQGVEIDGKTYYLSDFGIGTGNYFEVDEDERYAIHIDGNADDSYSAGKTDKLKAAIASDPELVTKFFTKLSANLYDNLTEKMASSDYSSIYKVYNDKKMKSDYDKYAKDIKNLEKKLSEAEDRYYKKFAAMEKAMAQLNSGANAIAGLFGMNQ